MTLTNLIPFAPAIMNLFGIGTKNNPLSQVGSMPMVIPMLVTLYSETNDAATRESLATILYFMTNGDPDALQGIQNSAGAMKDFKDKLDKLTTK